MVTHRQTGMKKDGPSVMITKTRVVAFCDAHYDQQVVCDSYVSLGQTQEADEI